MEVPPPGWTDLKKNSDSTDNGKCLQVEHKITALLPCKPNVKLGSNKNACLDLATQILR